MRYRIFFTALPLLLAACQTDTMPGSFPIGYLCDNGNRISLSRSDQPIIGLTDRKTGEQAVLRHYKADPDGRYSTQKGWNGRPMSWFSSDGWNASLHYTDQAGGKVKTKCSVMIDIS